MEKVLALDLSTKRTGWAYYEQNDCAVSYGALVENNKEIKQRILSMQEKVIELLKTLKVETIVIEEVRPDGYNNYTGKVLTWLQGAIVLAVYKYNPAIKVEFIGASSWRSKLGIQGYRVQREQQKIIDIEFINKKYNIELNHEQDDEADALGILAAFIHSGPEKKEKLKPIGSEQSAF